MAISIWFVHKDTGLPDPSMPARYAKDVDEAIALVRSHKDGVHGSSHYLRLSAPGGELSSADHGRLVGAGAVVTDEFLPDDRGQS
jgi:hypothetical protein